MLKNNHYKTVDGVVLLLHDEDVPRSGTFGNTLEQTRLTAELFFPDTRCPQGRLKKLTWPERPVQGREALAKILKTLVVDTENVVKEPPGFRCFSSL
ncbi:MULTISPECIES: hypothetical protein [unclassified Pseudomonas]|uniref:hypothetical protein n=1 Tax=unclassified Pseudomonas TaxID=196821 RepID=UPI001304A990|nr:MULTISPECIES: hypothetical protein [unclassified Pseudomonas]